MRFKDLSDFYINENKIWQMEGLLEKKQTLNQRFEDILLRSVKTRDEIRRGVRQSDEEIEISIYQWIHRYLPKTARYHYVDDVMVGDIKGRVICDLFEHHVEFEPIMSESEFVKALGNGISDYTSFTFGTKEADKLALLVKKEIKTATASLHYFYELENEKIPQAGDVSIVLYENKNVCCMIKNVSVDIVPFHEVPRLHAFLEGEGDRSLEYWKLVHHVFFHRELKGYDKNFDENMLVVLEKFKKVYEPMDVVRKKI